MLIDIATGVNTCADRVDLHNDGEERDEIKKKENAPDILQKDA